MPGMDSDEPARVLCMSALGCSVADPIAGNPYQRAFNSRGPHRSLAGLSGVQDQAVCSSLESAWRRGSKTMPWSGVSVVLLSCAAGHVRRLPHCVDPQLLPGEPLAAPFTFHAPASQTLSRLCAPRIAGSIGSPGVGSSSRRQPAHARPCASSTGADRRSLRNL